MKLQTRRDLITDIGRGMVVAGVGSSLAMDLGLAPAWAKEEPDRLSFGALDNLVDFFQETPADKLIPKVLEKLKKEATLKDMVAAAALANARAFGGEDYVGFHTLMALVPAYAISQEEQGKGQSLAVLKVLHRNATRLGEKGHAAPSVLKPVKPLSASSSGSGEQLRDLVRKNDLSGAEQVFAGICAGTNQDALSKLMVMVDDGAEVHRVVLVSRSWDLLNFVGKERAHTLLRQSVHYCVKAEKNISYQKEIRDVLPRVMDEHHLLNDRRASLRQADDKWVMDTAMAIFKSSPSQAAGLVGSIIAEGMNPIHIAEAITQAANQLVLRDRGRYGNQIQANKPEGSVHGDSIGVHACDSANAWRNIALAGDRRTMVTSLVLAGYQVARDRMERGGDFLNWTPYPRPEHLAEVRGIAADKLLGELEDAIKAKNQSRAAALSQRLSLEGKNDKAIFALLRKYAISEDGALHAEKYYRTVVEDYANARPGFRPGHLAALARVTASAYGLKAPGFSQASELLGLKGATS